MTGLVSAALAALFAPILAWWTTWAALVVRAAMPVRRPGDPTPKRLDVVVPAHDEERHVGALVRGLLDQEGPSRIGRVLVVADHCNDATAEVARAAGAEVLERTSGAPGKPPALREGIERLRAAADRGDAVVLLDGDCVVDRGFAAALGRRLAPDVDVVQAAYTLDEPDAGAVRSNLALAFALRNVVRARGADALRLPLVLFGSGMLFRWSALDHLSFGDPRLAGTGDTRPVADDVLMAIDLVAAGIHPVFAEDARVVAPTPDDDADLGAQRLRWEGGQALMWQHLPRAARAALRRRDWRALVALVDWSAPPLVATTAAFAGLSGVTVALVAVGGAAPWVLVLPLVAGGALGIYVVVGVHVLEGTAGVVALASSVPRFVGWKLRLYRSHRTARRVTGT